MPVLSVRVDARILDCVERIASRSGETLSEVARQALETLCQEHSQPAKISLADQIGDLIGAWDSGGARLSANAGRRFAEMLVHRARRS